MVLYARTTTLLMDDKGKTGTVYGWAAISRSVLLVESTRTWVVDSSTSLFV